MADGFAAIREQFHVPGPFPAAATAEADAAAVAERHDDRVDGRDLPIVTLDPAGSMDLDQGFALDVDGDDIVLSYAIADVGAFVAREGALAEEVWRRGVTVYAPDGRVPLHPPVLSEGAASLLPAGDRLAVLLTVARRRRRRLPAAVGEAGDRAQPGQARLRDGRSRRPAALARGAVPPDVRRPRSVAGPGASSSPRRRSWPIRRCLAG